MLIPLELRVPGQPGASPARNLGTAADRGEEGLVLAGYRPYYLEFRAKALGSGRGEAPSHASADEH